MAVPRVSEVDAAGELGDVSSGTERNVPDKLTTSDKLTTEDMPQATL